MGIDSVACDLKGWVDSPCGREPSGSLVVLLFAFFFFNAWCRDLAEPESFQELLLRHCGALRLAGFFGRVSKVTELLQQFGSLGTVVQTNVPVLRTGPNSLQNFCHVQFVQTQRWEGGSTWFASLHSNIVCRGL